MIGNRVLYCVGLIAAFIFHIFYFGWYSWFLLLLTLCLPLFSLLLSLPSMRRARLRITWPVRCVMGESAYITVENTSGDSLAPACRVRIDLHCPLTGSTRIIRGRVAGTAARRLRIDTSHTTLLQGTAVRSRVYDYLGLIGMPVKGAVGGEILVEPAAIPPVSLPEPQKLPDRVLRPKRGGGFAEEYELRPYREGDHPRDIHWKLSAKTDNLIVREALIPDRGRLVLSFDLRGTREQLDSSLGRLIWTSRWLLEHEVPHEVMWIDPTTTGVTGAQIHETRDLQPMLRRILGSPLREQLPDITDHLSSSWMHIPTEVPHEE
ncbi:MAG: DUF58 domain-containing protein [Clostridia bacterium]|nr:DUF58 domain-containing protein [Clostridia bacterium]